MKRILAVSIAAFALAIFLAGSVYAGSFGISPSQIQVDVPANSTATVEFKVYNFTGDVQISTENIPLRISPDLAYLSPENNTLKITFFGNGNSRSETYEGKILFLASGNDGLNMGIKVKARVTNVAERSFLSRYGLILGLLAGAMILGSAVVIYRRYYLRF